MPIEVVKGDLLDPNSLVKSLDNVDYVVHIAGITKAKNKSDYYIGNIKSTQNLLNASIQFSKIKKFCFISSLTAVGPSLNGIPLKETAQCRPITTYGKSKLEAEQICKQYESKIPIVILRPPAVFGPRDTDILEMFKWVSKGFKPVIGSSEKTLSLIFAPDLAEAIELSTINNKTDGEIYNIADPTIFTYSSLMDYLSLLVQKKTIPLHLPKGIVYSMAGIMQFFAEFVKKPAVLNIEKARDLLQKHWTCDVSKIYEHIGFRTSTSIYEGLNKTFKWYKDIKWI